MKLLYTAAHGGPAEGVSIGGGGAIARQLLAEWAQTKPFSVELICPTESPQELVQYSQGEYTRFCDRFRREATNRILREDPAQCVVLANDISEGPDFALLARHGYRVFTIWHVDVLVFVMRMYLKGLVKPQQAARWMRPLEDWLPGPLGLVFANQHRCVRHSVGHFVMTEAMKQTILECYPETPPEKIHVVPWGASRTGELVEQPKSEVPQVLMLSRISPEKGQHRVLEALRHYKGKLRVVIAGNAAFMGGEKYLAKLRRLADDRVRFVGHLSGQAKTDAFAAADLYVFPSVSESYGLTLMEALAHGVPVIAWDHDGARAILNPEIGILVANEREFLAALEALIGDPERRRRMGQAARAFAAARPFSASAARLAATLLG
jgi:glycosyltransferase involved in cell wall biosynthesis